MGPIPDNFDWVTVRYGCCAAKAFEKLKLQSEADIKSRNSKLSPDDRYHFFLQTGTTSFTVAVSMTNGAAVPAHQYDAITFTVVGKEIIVCNSQAEMFRAGLTINDEAECRFKIGEREYDFWQVRKMAFEKLFFVNF